MVCRLASPCGRGLTVTRLTPTKYGTLVVRRRIRSRGRIPGIVPTDLLGTFRMPIPINAWCYKSGDTAPGRL